jgi:hypothetical protein
LAGRLEEAPCSKSLPETSPTALPVRPPPAPSSVRIDCSPSLSTIARAAYAAAATNRRRRSGPSMCSS